MKAFVTGSTGCLGRHLVHELLAHGYAVTALVRTMDRARSLPPGLRFTAGDITRPDSLRAGMRGVEVVFHLAALHQVGLRPRDRERLWRVNVQGARQTLALAGELGVPRVVFVSDLQVYGDSGGQVLDESSAPDESRLSSEYARSKHRAHFEAAREWQVRGLPLVIVCPGALIGPGDSSYRAPWLRRYARRRLPAMLGAGRSHSWLGAASAAAGLRLAAERGRVGETYFLAGPSLTYREFLAECQHESGLPMPWLWLPAGMEVLLARAARQADPALAETLMAFAPGACLARSDRARAELGWRAAPLASAIRDTMAWFQE